MRDNRTPNSICEQCGTSFYIKPSHLSRRRYCSKACHNASMVKSREILQSDLDRFWSKVDKSAGPDGCWVWTGAHDHKLGYGNFSIRTNKGIQTVAAHRFSMKLIHGDTVESAHVLHNCPGGDNPQCVNPSHLMLGTHTDNMRDMWSKGRGRKSWPIGDDVKHAILTEANVIEARQRFVDTDLSIDKMAKEYGVDRTTLTKAIDGENWAHLRFPAPTVSPEEAERIRRIRDFNRRPVRSKLTPEEVRNVRTMYANGGWSYKRLGQQFGVTHTTIENIVKRKIWKGIK